MTDLGAEQFTGKEKRAYEARKIVERGGRVSCRATACFLLSICVDIIVCLTVYWLANSECASVV